MKNTQTHNEKLFSKIVFYLEEVVAKPYLSQMNEPTHNELARVFNGIGIKNSKGENLTKDAIKKCIQRTTNKNDFYPEIFKTQNDDLPKIYDLGNPGAVNQKQTQSEKDLESFTYSIINNNHSHFYGEKLYA